MNNNQNFVKLLIASWAISVAIAIIVSLISLILELFPNFDSDSILDYFSFRQPNAQSDHISGYRYSFNPSKFSINKIDVGFKNDTPFVWVATRQTSGRIPTGLLEIVNPIKKEVVASIFSGQLGISGYDISAFERQGKYFCIPEKNGLQLRAADGELVENGETLSKKFPELSAGIGKAEKLFGERNWFLITTKDGFQYMYFPQERILMTQQDFRKKERKIYDYYDIDPTEATDKDYEFRYAWGLSKTNESVRQQLYLTKKYAFSLAPEYGPSKLEDLVEESKRGSDIDSVTGRRRARRYNHEKLVMIAPDVFLDGKILASNSQHCLVLHSQTIEKNADKILSCVNREGKTLWQIVAPKFKALQKVTDNQITGVIHDNTAAIINSLYGNIAVCGLDIQTGQLLWEFAAF